MKRVTAAVHDQYGSWREGEHDDLVLAVALACWTARKVYPNDGADRLFPGMHVARE